MYYFLWKRLYYIICAINLSGTSVILLVKNYVNVYLLKSVVKICFAMCWYSDHCFLDVLVMFCWQGLLKELTSNCDGQLKCEITQLAAAYEHSLQLGQKSIYHLEAFVAKFMAIYKRFLEEGLVEGLNDFFWKSVSHRAPKYWHIETHKKGSYCIICAIDLLGTSVVLLVGCWTTDHYYPSSNLGVGISERHFIFDFASLPLKVAQSI